MQWVWVAGGVLALVLVCLFVFGIKRCGECGKWSWYSRMVKCGRCKKWAHRTKCAKPYFAETAAGRIAHTAKNGRPRFICPQEECKERRQVIEG